MENRHCPICGKQTLRYIETCESDSDTVKTSWTCDCTDMMVYIYQFVQA